MIVLANELTYASGHQPGNFVPFYDFPQEHWVHLRTTNAIESVFAGVRLRTGVAKA